MRAGRVVATVLDMRRAAAGPAVLRRAVVEALTRRGARALATLLVAVLCVGGGAARITLAVRAETVGTLGVAVPMAIERPISLEAATAWRLFASVVVRVRTVGTVTGFTTVPTRIGACVSARRTPAVGVMALRAAVVGPFAPLPTPETTRATATAFAHHGVAVRPQEQLRRGLLRLQTFQGDHCVVNCWMRRIMPTSRRSASVTARPLRPARPVRPMRCT
jgi:hypothetical protein